MPFTKPALATGLKRMGLLITLFLACGASSPKNPYFQIAVVDQQTGRGVPLVELETVNNIRLVTDSNGLIAFTEPGLMDTLVYFQVKSHGYEYPADGFGFRGVRLTPSAGGSAQIKLKRINIAERLYRITGQGIYRDTVLLGLTTPTTQPVLNGQVLGQDSIQRVIHRGTIHWFWGDTNRASYPLGQFAMSGATSQLPATGGLDPAVGVNLHYFIDKDGFSRKMCPLPEPGMVWLDGFLVIPDQTGQERIIAHYARMKSLGEMVEHGLCIYNDTTDTFEKLLQLDLEQQWRSPRGHPLRVRDQDQDQDYFHFPMYVPNVRVRANFDSIKNPAAYEAFTCLRPGSTYDKSNPQLDRDPAGRLLYAWKPNTDPIGQKEERELLAANKITRDEARFLVRDVDSGKDVTLHAGSVNFNDFRKKYIMIVCEIMGSSMLGETWYAESDSPTGPWLWARKIVTHDKYSFYNPAHHPFFDQAGGRLIYFEGTYTHSFSGNPVQTPRYDYNQIMYRLDLADPRLGLPLKRTQ